MSVISFSSPTIPTTQRGGDTPWVMEIETAADAVAADAAQTARVVEAAAARSGAGLATRATARATSVPARNVLAAVETTWGGEL